MQFSKHIRRALCVFLLHSCSCPAAQAATLSRSERTLLGAVNDVRAAHNLRPLRIDTSSRPRRPRLLGDADPPRHLHPRLSRPSGWRATASAARSSARTSPGARASAPPPAPSSASGWRAPVTAPTCCGPAGRRIGIGSRIGTFLGYPGATVVTADFAGCASAQVSAISARELAQLLAPELVALAALQPVEQRRERAAPARRG